MTAVDIVKNSKRNDFESFNRSKLHKSIIATCLSAQTPEGQAKKIADLVCDEVEKWLESRQEVTSTDIRVVASRHLRAYHPDAAYLYEQHRIMI
jgi:transcriptional regulator NrdR family protein